MHVGTLLAVILYFRADVWVAAAGAVRLARGKVDTPGAFLALCLLIATIPVMAAGLALRLTGLDEALRSVAVIGWAMIIFGAVLYWADRTGSAARQAGAWTLRHAAIMGLWQVLALIPGTSRSGITITGGRQLGYDRHSAAKLAMLMSIPTILASGGLLGLEAATGSAPLPLRDCAIGAAMAFVAALAALSLMMRLLRSVSFTPYVVYRMMLGVALLVYAYA